MTPRLVEIRLPLDLESPSAARELLRETCAGLADELVEAALLLATEVVTNAVLHAGSSPCLTISCFAEGTSSGIRVEVSDESPWMPDASPPDTHAPGGTIDLTSVSGRGLSIVESVASSWGVRANGAGKTIWFELDRES